MDGELGPAMYALPNNRMRAFVEATFDHPGANPTEWARVAGYAGTDNGGIRVQAHRLWHDARIQAAIFEEASRRFRGLAPFALDVMVQVAANPQANDAARIKAAQVLLDRGGFHGVTEQKITHKVLTDDREKLARLAILANKLGIDPSKLVGQRAAAQIEAPREAVDAEFKEVINIEDYV